MPNQDAAASRTLQAGAVAIAAVADGHGSARSFRSHLGSAMAVEAATEICAEFLEDLGTASPSAVKDAGERFLFDRIWQTWRELVQEHFAANGFTDEELAAVEARDGVEGREKALLSDQLFVAYGSTLLLAATTPSYLLAIQLGDGTIAVTSDTEENVTFVVPVDAEATAAVNETSSLCDDDASRRCIFRYMPFVNGMPACVMLSTDGYWNSFRNPDESFPRVVREYVSLLRKRGATYIQDNLPTWLDDVSQQGVGDDTTASLIHRVHPPLADSLIPPAASAENERDVQDGLSEEGRESTEAPRQTRQRRTPKWFT